MCPYVLTVTLNPALDKTVTIEKFNFGGLNRVTDIRMDAGGKGINVAKVLNKFRVGVVAAGFIAGNQGQKILNCLSEEKVETKFLTVPGETRTNLKIVDATAHVTTEVNEPGFHVSPQDLESFKDMASHLLDHARFLVLSGSLPQGVSENIYSYLILLARNKGVPTILDADGPALVQGIEAVPYAVKPNIYELQKLSGRKMESHKDIVDAGGELLKKGIKTVAVTMGESGCIVIDSREVLRAEAFPVTPGSTVGAGDAAAAALVYALINQYSLEKTSRFITAAGTVTASKPGTQVCSLEEVLQCMEAVTVKPLIF